MDMLPIQIEMEKLFNNNQLLPRIRREFTDQQDVDFGGIMDSYEIDQDFGFDLLVQMVLRKRGEVSIMVGIMRRHFDSDGEHNPEASQMAADMLLKCAEADLVDFDGNLNQFIVKWDISPDVQEDLDRYQYPLPMVIIPKEVNNNNDTGYFTSRGSIILKHNHHDEDICLDHINRMNKIPLRINLDVVFMIQNQWRNLDHAKPGENRKDYQARVKAFEKYDRTSRDIIEHLAINGNEFYLTHRYDKRGRVYSQGYHVNYQGNAWNKACVEFFEGEIVND